MVWVEHMLNTFLPYDIQVLVWNSKMELGATFNASTMGPVKNSITSICYDALTSKVLVTFQTCEVFEMDGTDGRLAHALE